MSYLLVALLGITIVTIGWWTRYCWLRLVYAISFLIAQLLVLALLLDVHAHMALKAEIEKRGAVPESSHVVMKAAQIQDRASAVLATVGLFLLAVFPQRAPVERYAAAPERSVRKTERRERVRGRSSTSAQ